MIIFDPDPRFTSKFWISLFDLLGTNLWFSTAFHPQTNGQLERRIQTLENFLRLYVKRNPSEWTQHLPLAKFASNNAVGMATGYCPFNLNGNEHPIVPLTFLRMSLTSQMVVVQEKVDRMKAALENAKLNLTVAQIRMKEYADRSQRSETFCKGTEVLLSTRNLWVDLHLTLKLWRRWIGPYKVTEVTSPVAYRLDLPPAGRDVPAATATTALST